jgi:hypothetical protein
MAGTEDMIRWAERSLGTKGRPNTITNWYAGRNGAGFRTSPWCNMSITYWANGSGNAAAVTFGRDYAYTVWHAQRFRSEGQWHVDVAGIRRGDIVFFDWSGSNDISTIDHVGIVTGVRGSVVYTIEGNTSDGCWRKTRYASTIVGYGRPEYGDGRGRARKRASDSAPDGIPVLKRGSAGVLVRQLQRCLNKVEQSGLGVDGDFGPRTERAVRHFQRSVRGLVADGEYGPKTAGKLDAARKRKK